MNSLFTTATLASSLALAQSIVPVHEEPHHTPVFENAWVKVLDVHFEAGVESLFHRHAVHNLAVRIVGGTTRADSPEGQGSPREVPTGSVVFHSASPPYVHRVVNVGTGAVHIVDVELLGARTTSASGAPDDLAGHVVEIENDYVRVSRVRLRAGESLAGHTHRRGWLDVVVTGPKPGAIAWHDGGRRTSITVTPAALEWVEVEPK